MTRHVYSLIGAGGTGSLLFRPLLTYLRNYHGNWKEDFLLAVIDGDTIETKNLDRQLYGFNQIGQNKAEALVGVESNAVAVAEYLGPDNIERLIAEQDTVIIAVDNYPVRSRIADRARQLRNVTVINLGNEDTWGNLTLWVRRDERNVTPPIDFQHPEINAGGADRAEMSCQQVAELPGGEQTIAANMMSAAWGLATLNALHLFDSGATADLPWTEHNWELAREGSALGLNRTDAYRKSAGKVEVAA